MPSSIEGWREGRWEGGMRVWDAACRQVGATSGWGWDLETEGFGSASPS